MAIELRPLRSSLALLAGALVIGIAGDAIAWQLARKQEQAWRRAVAQREAAEARLAEAGRETAGLARGVRLFDALRDHIGPEHRNRWLARIATIQAERGIDTLHYEFSPRRPLESGSWPEGSIAGGYAFMASTMKLRAELLHEEDLLRLLADLGRDMHAFVHVRACNLARGAGKLDAECAADWITLREQP